MVVQPGIGVDAHGGAVIDPTANVLSLVEAAVKRLDDLRGAETRRNDELRDLNSRHAQAMQDVVLSFQNQLREAEAKRIDAIRAVDVNAVAVASGRATDQAAVLATQVQVSADALRALVSTTAATMATAQAAASAEFAKRLAELERSKYEVAGRTGVTDPQMAQLLEAVQTLRESRSTVAGKSAGFSASWALLVGAMGLFLTMLTIGGVLLAVLKR